MPFNECYGLFINGIVQTLAELEWEMLEYDDNYNIYFNAIHDLLNSLDWITKSIVINEINKHISNIFMVIKKCLKSFELLMNILYNSIL